MCDQCPSDYWYAGFGSFIYPWGTMISKCLEPKPISKASGDTIKFRRYPLWEDAMTYGTGVSKDGEHVPFKDFSADLVNEPPHYKNLPKCECGHQWEVIDITENLPFCLGNAIKYLLRAEHKDDFEQDLKKAQWYIKRELERRGY